MADRLIADRFTPVSATPAPLIPAIKAVFASSTAVSEVFRHESSSAVATVSVAFVYTSEALPRVSQLIDPARLTRITRVMPPPTPIESITIRFSFHRAFFPTILASPKRRAKTPPRSSASPALSSTLPP